MKVRLLIFVLLLTGGTLAAQQPAAVTVTRSTQIITEGNQRYYEHQVKKGETVYSICRAYGITEADLRRDNPKLDGYTLPVDMVLRILVTPSNSTPAPHAEHIVQVKETLYSIAKQYGVSVDEIVALNPESDKSLTIGRILQIPLAKKAAASATPAAGDTAHHEPAVSNGQATLQAHVIQRKETLFSLSNKYEVSIDDIKRYNPQIFGEEKGKLKVGKILYIPVSLSGLKKGDDAQSTAGRTQCDSLGQHLSSINVAILLPFNAEQQDDAEQLYRSFRFLEVYEGALLALDKLRQQGLSVRLSVLDTKSATPQALTLNPSLAKADLIIGPVYHDAFKPVADFARQRNIKIISPLAPIDSSLYGYSNVFQVPVDFDKQVQQALVHDRLDPRESNLILVSQRDEAGSTMLRNYYRRYLPQTDSAVYSNVASGVRKDSVSWGAKQHKPVVKMLSYKLGLHPSENMEVFSKILNPNLENKIVVASQDEPFVADLLTNLKTFSDRQKCRITIYGTNSWQKFENLDLTLFYELKLHIAAPYYVDYKSEVVKEFVASYREQYKTEPSQFAFQGYDIMLYFASAMYRYGKNFEGCLPYHKAALLQSNYSFAPIRPGGAYENNGVFLLRYTPWMEIVQYK